MRAYPRPKRRKPIEQPWSDVELMRVTLRKTLDELDPLYESLPARDVAITQ